MKTFAALLFLFSLSFTLVHAQAELPLREIPEAPEDFGPGNVMARMIEGLAYRYYWATEGLREEDLAYRPTPEARSSSETLAHILGLSETVLNAAKNQPNVRPADPDPASLSFEEQRSRTLQNLAEAAKIMRGMTEAEVAELKVMFQNGDNITEFPYWNMINGPISDAIWHTGQIVTFRRSSGNPINPKASMLRGKLRE